MNQIDEYKYRKGFTLVELIIAITILAILAVLSFVSFGYYTKYARDSVRISDMKNISSSLELYRVKYGYYRDPYNYFSVSDNGLVLWKQGTIGNDFYQIGTLKEKPLDPLLSVEYTYSVNADNSIYQIGGITESVAQY